MKEKQITGLFYNVETHDFDRVTINNSLESLYELLKVDLIDIVEVNIQGTSYDIVLDDEGVLKENPIISAISLDCKIQYVGNLFICHHDRYGNLTSLKEDELQTVVVITIPNIITNALALDRIEY